MPPSRWMTPAGETLRPQLGLDPPGSRAGAPAGRGGSRRQRRPVRPVEADPDGERLTQSYAEVAKRSTPPSLRCACSCCGCAAGSANGCGGNRPDRRQPGGNRRRNPAPVRRAGKRIGQIVERGIPETHERNAEANRRQPRDKMGAQCRHSMVPQDHAPQSGFGHWFRVFRVFRGGLNGMDGALWCGDGLGNAKMQK